MTSSTIKVTVTVDRQAIEWIDERVKNKTFRNRSHGVDVALDKYIKSQKK